MVMCERFFSQAGGIWSVFPCVYFLFFFFNDTATTEIYTLSLHDALPICSSSSSAALRAEARRMAAAPSLRPLLLPAVTRSEEHTSELQSPCNLVCRLLLEKKKTKPNEASTLLVGYPPHSSLAASPAVDVS